jgi:hypothetical protein
MRNRIATVLGAGAIVTTVLALGTMTAQAASTWTVTNGGSALAFNLAGSGTLKDVTSGATFSGTSGSVTLTAPSGRYSSGSGFSSFYIPLPPCPGYYWFPCFSPWAIDAVSYESGVTSGTASGSGATLAVTNAAGTCTGSVSGTMDVSYNNSSHTITFSPDASLLSLSGVSGGGCSLARLANGDVLDFNATLTESAGPYLTITSP